MRTSLKPANIVTFLLFLAVFLYALATLAPPRYDSAFDIATFSRLPMQEGGRVKPLDSIARNALLVLRHRHSLPNTPVSGPPIPPTDGDTNPREIERRPPPEPRGPATLSPSEWLFLVFTDRAYAASLPVFRIDHPDVVNLLGFDNRSRKHFAFNDLLPHLEALHSQLQLVDPEPQLRSPYERALVQLDRQIGIYDRLSATFVPPPLMNTVTEEYESLLNLIPIANAAGSTDAVPADPRLRDSIRLFEGRYGRLAQSLSKGIAPPSENAADPQHWDNLGESLLLTLQTGKIDPLVAGYAYLDQFVDEGNFKMANGILSDLALRYEDRAPDAWNAVGFELFFNNLDPFATSRVLYVIAFLAVALSWLFWPRQWAWTALAITVIALTLHTFGLGARMIIQDRPPVTNLYSSAVFIGWFAVLTCVLLELIYRNTLATAVASLTGFANLLIASALAQDGDTLEMMRAVLDSNFWLGTHVITITVGYAATFVAGLLAAIYLIAGLFTKRVDKATATSIDRMVYGVICFALLFSFVGTVLGGIWADQSWGRFWGWDPKENGALMIVLWTALVLHLRWGRIGGRKTLMASCVFGNVITSWSWFGTNMLGIGLHSYGFMDSAFLWLIAFCVSQFAIMALATIPPRFWRSEHA